MKNKSWIAPLALTLSGVLLGGAGTMAVMGGMTVPESEHTSVVSERDRIKDENIDKTRYVKKLEGELAVKPEVVEKEITPQSCLDLADYADQSLVIALAMVSVVSDGMVEAAGLNVAGIESTGDEVDGLMEKLDTVAPKYAEAKDSCRGAGA